MTNETHDKLTPGEHDVMKIFMAIVSKNRISYTTTNARICVMRSEPRILTRKLDSHIWTNIMAYYVRNHVQASCSKCERNLSIVNSVRRTSMQCIHVLRYASDVSIENNNKSRKLRYSQHRHLLNVFLEGSVDLLSEVFYRLGHIYRHCSDSWNLNFKASCSDHAKIRS